MKFCCPLFWSVKIERPCCNVNFCVASWLLPDKVIGDGAGFAVTFTVTLADAEPPEPEHESEYVCAEVRLPVL